MGYTTEMNFIEMNTIVHVSIHMQMCDVIHLQFDKQTHDNQSTCIQGISLHDNHVIYKQWRIQLAVA